jgi:3-oxoacyl-[acyl-carrier-protein] synthase II
VTGIGIVSSFGEGAEAQISGLSVDAALRLDDTAFAPYPVHPLVPLDLAKQIPKKSDQRQMEAWQRIGVYAAGLALDDAKVARNAYLLARTNLVVAAGSGERDTGVDAKVLESIDSSSDSVVLAKEVLPTALRPTLFLAQLSNLLAGNISIVHNVTGSSRTFMGEEMAGISAIENACRRIGAGQGDLFLAGGALNAERADLLLNFELGHNLWPHQFRSVWERNTRGGGFVAGSVGAFLVLEARENAEARGAAPYARISGIVSDRSGRQPDAARDALILLLERLAGHLAAGPLAVLSGASGVEPVTAEELEFLVGLEGQGLAPAIRAYGSRLGHSVEAHFPVGIALAALALKAGSFYPPLDTSGVEQPLPGPLQRVLVTGCGHWRGEGLALLEPAL